MNKYKANTHGITEYSLSTFYKKLDSFIHSKGDKLISVNILPSHITSMTLRKNDYPYDEIDVEVNIYKAIIIYNEAIY